jgi:hypothetical protein
MKRFLVAFGLLLLVGLHPAGAVGFQWAGSGEQRNSKPT